MQIFVYLILFLFILNTQSSAQHALDSTNKKADYVNYPAYRFSAFEPGMVCFRNKDTVPVALNFHVARNEIQFINERGDTLVLIDPLTIGKVIINAEEFFFSKDKWIQKIETKAGIVLGYYTNVHIEINPSRSGFAGYGNVNPSHAMFSNFLVQTKDLYFFGDAYGNFTKATRNNLLTYFGRRAPIIKQYLNTHTIDFKKLSDLQNVLRFCDTLN